MIGVQSNHDVEYFGSPAAPNLRFQQNLGKYGKYLHNLSSLAYNSILQGELEILHHHFGLWKQCAVVKLKFLVFILAYESSLQWWNRKFLWRGESYIVAELEKNGKKSKSNLFWSILVEPKSCMLEGTLFCTGHSKWRVGSYVAAELQNSWEKVKIQPFWKPSSWTEISYAGGDEIVNGRFKVKGRVLCSSRVAK